MQNFRWRTRAVVARIYRKSHRASKPQNATSSMHLAPSNEPLKSNNHEGKVLGGFRWRCRQHEARRIQMKGGPWSVKVNPLARPSCFA